MSNIFNLKLNRCNWGELKLTEDMLSDNHGKCCRLNYSDSGDVEVYQMQLGFAPYQACVD